MYDGDDLECDNSNEFNITLKKDTSNTALGMSIKLLPMEGKEPSKKKKK